MDRCLDGIGWKIGGEQHLHLFFFCFLYLALGLGSGV